MRPVYILACLMLLAVAPASAQKSLAFPDTRCDSSICSSFAITNDSPFPDEVISIRMRDSTSFIIAPAQTLPHTISATSTYQLPVCFRAGRRGVIVDSLEVLVLKASGQTDTIRVRLTGRGVGPELSATPTVLTFPKTNPGSNARLSVMFRNNGETPYRMTAASLNLVSPFRLLTLLPVNIDPGDSLQVEIAFEPKQTGVYPLLLNILAGCSSQLQLSLNGITDFNGTGAVLQISKLGFNPVNNEQSTCNAATCAEMTLTNAGNAPLTIDNLTWMRDIGYALTPAPTTPLVIPPNSRRVFQVCLNSRSRGQLRDTLRLVSNTRNSIAFGVVIDVSNSMLTPMTNCAGRPTRILQARTQASQFVGRTLLHLPAVGVQDYLAVGSYGTLVYSIFPLTAITEAGRIEAQRRIDTLTASGGRTSTGEALKRMFDTLAKQPLNNRIVVLLTDGEATDTVLNPVSSIVDRARQRGVKIFTIGVGLSAVANRYIGTLASQTGGISFDGSDCDSLQSAFETITEIVSRGTVYNEPFAMRVTAPLLVTSGNIVYDTLHLRDTACQTITLTNVGEGAAKIDLAELVDSMGAPNPEYFLGSDVTFPIDIPENGQKTVTVCFRPSGLRTRRGIIRFKYNNCAADTLQARLLGNSITEANLRVTDNLVGLPGETVHMPIYSDSSLVNFEIHKATYTLRWNKTMLTLGEVRAAAGAPGATVALAGPVTYSGRYAIAKIDITGETFTGSGPLAEIDFKVLRGDTLATIVEIITGQFEDDNPTVLVVNAGSVALDSTCFRESKPLMTQGSAAKVTAGEFTPTPSTGGTIEIALESTEATMVEVDLYSVDGQRRRSITGTPIEQGNNRIALDLDGIGDGSYYAIFRTAAGETFVRTLVIAR